MKKNIIKALFVFMFLIQVLPINVMASDVQEGQPAVEETTTEQQALENIPADQQGVENTPVENMSNEDEGIELINEGEEIDISQHARGIDNLSVKKSFLDTVKDNLFLVTSLIIVSIFAVTIFIKLKRKK